MVWGVEDVRRAMDFWCAALDDRPLHTPDDTWPNPDGNRFCVVQK